MTLATGDPVALGMAPTGFAFNENDPVLSTPAGARAVVRYTSPVKVSGFADGTADLAGTAATVVDGRAVLFAFDPSYRGYYEWGQRLLANALLLPARSFGGRPAPPRP